MYTDSQDAGRGGFVMGLICGTAVGAALGMMFAPKAGSDLRRQLADSGERFKRVATDKYEEASGAVNDLVSRGREAVDRGREAYQRTRETAADEFPASKSYPAV
jgi:gas vesicle protein